MSLLGKIVAVLNILAAAGFCYLAALDYSKRQIWSHAVYRYQLAVEGLPVDDKDPDKDKVAESVLKQIFAGGEVVKTQTAELDRLEKDLRAKMENAEKGSLGLGTPTEKAYDVLLALALSAPEREELLLKQAKNADEYATLLPKIQKHFEDARSVNEKDPVEKKRRIAHLLVSLIDVLPTDEERKTRQEQEQKNKDLVAGGGKPEHDFTSSPGYKRVLAVIGVRQMARELEQQAQRLAEMEKFVGQQRRTERLQFAALHQQWIEVLSQHEMDLPQQREILKVIQSQIKDQKKLLESPGETIVEDGKERLVRVGQREYVKKFYTDIVNAYQRTTKDMEAIEGVRQRLFTIRLQLRDANATLQQLEQEIRKLQAQR